MTMTMTMTMNTAYEAVGNMTAREHDVRAIERTYGPSPYVLGGVEYWNPTPTWEGAQDWAYSIDGEEVMEGLEVLAEEISEAYRALFADLDALQGDVEVFLGRDMDIAVRARRAQLKAQGVRHPHRNIMRLEVNRYMAAQLSDEVLALAIDQQCPRLAGKVANGSRVILIDSGFMGSIPSRLWSHWGEKATIKAILMSAEYTAAWAASYECCSAWGNDEYELRAMVLRSEHRPHRIGTVTRVDDNGHIVEREDVSPRARVCAGILEGLVLSEFHNTNVAGSPVVQHTDTDVLSQEKFRGALEGILSAIKVADIAKWWKEPEGAV